MLSSTLAIINVFHKIWDNNYFFTCNFEKTWYFKTNWNLSSDGMERSCYVGIYTLSSHLTRNFITRMKHWGAVLLLFIIPYIIQTATGFLAYIPFAGIIIIHSIHPLRGHYYHTQYTSPLWALLSYALLELFKLHAALSPRYKFLLAKSLLYPPIK